MVNLVNVKNKIRAGQGGATLIGLMTSMVVSSITAGAGIMLIQFLLKSVTNVKNPAEFRTIAILASKAVGHGDVCKAGFLGAKFTIGNTTATFDYTVFPSMPAAQAGAASAAAALANSLTSSGKVHPNFTMRPVPAGVAAPLNCPGFVPGTPYAGQGVCARFQNFPATLAGVYDTSLKLPKAQFLGEIWLVGNKPADLVLNDTNTFRAAIPILATFIQNPADPNSVIVDSCNSYSKLDNFISTADRVVASNFQTNVNTKTQTPAKLQEACEKLGMKWKPTAVVNGVSVAAHCEIKASTAFCSQVEGFGYNELLSDCKQSTCPTGYVAVTNDPLYVSKPFCVAKFEMRNIGGVPASQAAGVPWASITRNAAETACTALGAGYHLIKNYEWENMVRDIEEVPANWSGGAVKSGHLNIGNFGPTPTTVTDESNPCKVDAGNQYPNCLDKAHNDFYYKRSHILSTGDTVWDLGGGVMEWTGTNGGGAVPNGTRDYTCGALMTAKDKYHFGTKEDYTANCAAIYTARNFTGYVEGTGGGLIIRGSQTAWEGSGWNVCTGIFFANTNAYWTTSQAQPNVGFRCAYTTDPVNTVYGAGQPP